MASYQLLITDLTSYGDLRCVAGFDLDRRIMVRPEPAPAAFWPSSETGSGRAFNPGNIVKFDAAPPKPATDYPHFTEDRVVTGGIEFVRTVDQNAFRDILTEIATPISSIFGEHANVSNGSAHVARGTQCSSLYGAVAERDAVRFSVRTWEGKSKPRLMIATSKGDIDLSIAATEIRELYGAEGLAGVSRLFAKSAGLLLRIGLARGFGDYPDRCYFQVNGIYPD